jgi:hypothetical protein
MQLVYYPVAEIQKNMIGHNIKIKEIKNKGIKRIFYNNGIPFVEIEYSGRNIWKSQIRYKNLERNYQYIIYNL